MERFRNSSPVTRQIESLALAPPSGTLTNSAIAATVTVLIISICIVMNPECVHWFVLPLAVCGILTGSDVVAWLRKEIDIFDPRAIIGILWFHNTCLAALLHISLQIHTPLFDRDVQDWREWFGRMAVMNVFALASYRLASGWAFSRTTSVRRVWFAQPGRFAAVLSFALLISFAAMMYILKRYGGLHKEAGLLGDPSEVIHLSWILMLADPFLVLLLLGVVKNLESPTLSPNSLIAIMGLMIALLLGQALILGFRGSRSALLYALFIGAGFCHYRLRRIPLSIVLCGALLIGMGGYYYTFFKRYGTTGLEAVTNPMFKESLSHRAGISPMGVILGDLSRAEIQALILRKLADTHSDYRLRMGKTYAASVLTFIPRAIWPGKPSDYLGKGAAGTDLQFGAGSFKPHRFKSSRVYGLGGEAMLNFGPLGVPAAYFAFGLFVGWYRRKVASLPPQDSRWYLVPITTLMIFTLAFGDSDNAMFLFLKNGMLVIVVIVLGSSIRPLSWSGLDRNGAREGSNL